MISKYKYGNFAEIIFLDFGISAVFTPRDQIIPSQSHLLKQGFTEMPDMDKFDGVNSKLGSRCKERIIRCMQMRAREQLEGTKKAGYLQKWRRNYAQSGWWCDHCDYFTFFPAQAGWETLNLYM